MTRIAALDIQSHKILLQAQNHKGRVLHQEQIDRPNPELSTESLGALLDSLLGELKGRHELFVALPVESLTLRILDLPFTETKQIAGVIPFEMEPFLTRPLETTTLSHEVLFAEQGRSRVLALAAPTDLMECLHTHAEAHGHRLTWATAAPIALAGLHSDDVENELILEGLPQQIRLALIQDGHLQAARSIGLPTPEEASRRLRPTLMPLLNHNPSLQCTGNIAARDLLASLGEGWPEVQVFSSEESGSLVLKGFFQPKAMKRRRLNLMTAALEQGRSKRIRLPIVLHLFILAAILIITYQRGDRARISLEQEMARVQERQQAVLARLLPGEPADRALIELDAMVNEKGRRADALLEGGGTLQQSSALRFWIRVRKCLPPAKDWHMKRLDVEGSKLVIELTTADFTRANALIKAVKADTHLSVNNRSMDRTSNGKVSTVIEVEVEREGGRQ
ncbi:MAG: hypothetical protein ACYTGH_00105 [Planctomycetota bacterium]|jgi:hypothetical protein